MLSQYKRTMISIMTCILTGALYLYHGHLKKGQRDTYDYST